MTFKKIGGPLLGFILAGCMLLMLLHPEASLAAALRGLAIWWDVLFPSLFPFFVISEIMLGLGIVHLFGALLDPLMRPSSVYLAAVVLSRPWDMYQDIPLEPN